MSSDTRALVRVLLVLGAARMGRLRRRLDTKMPVSA
jgi:hypothetical protein